MNKDRSIMRIDIETQKLFGELKEDPRLLDYEYFKLINAFDRFQELIKLIEVKPCKWVDEYKE